MNYREIKILVVDDEPNNLRFLNKILTEQGYQVQKTISGQLAINAAIADPPDLILLDIMMPQMNGYEVCQKLKAIDKFCDIPIIFLSALKDVNDKVKAFELGGVDYITKPFQIEEVLARIKNQLLLSSCQKKLQRQNYCFQQELHVRKQVEKKKDELISFIGHEIKTPLTSIQASLFLLISGRFGKLESQGIRLLEIAANNTERLVRMLNNILDLERIESGIDIARKQNCDLGNLMVQAAEMMQAMAEKAEVSLSISPLSVQRYVNPDHIIQILTNLLSNAIKFSSPGSTVWLSASLQPAEEIDNITEEFISSCPYLLTASPHSTIVLFKVKDQGRGIPSDKLELIFSYFEQVDISDLREKGGTGLGLAICRKIVHQYGGKIWVESSIGLGSTFYFTLPEFSPDYDTKANESMPEPLLYKGLGTRS